MSKDQKTINKLFRDLIRVYSTSTTSMIGLDSMQTAIKELICKNNNLEREIIKLSDTVKNTQPRMFPLDNLMLILDKEIQSLSYKKQLTKESATQILEVFRDRLKLDLDELVESGTEWIKDGDFIVIHSIEENIEHLIPAAKKKGIKFKILLLQQDIVTTEQILIILNENKIDFEVIPEYDLVHYVDKINKLFLGTQSLTKDDYLICDPGTSNIVSECHIYNIPVLLFLKTLKFSNYSSKDQNIFKNHYQDKYKEIEYNYSIHSNDIIQLKLIDHIITEKGEVPLEEISIIREQVFLEFN